MSPAYLSYGCDTTTLHSHGCHATGTLSVAVMPLVLSICGVARHWCFVTTHLALPPPCTAPCCRRHNPPAVCSGFRRRWDTISRNCRRHLAHQPYKSRATFCSSWCLPADNFCCHLRIPPAIPCKIVLANNSNDRFSSHCIHRVAMMSALHSSSLRSSTIILQLFINFRLRLRGHLCHPRHPLAFQSLVSRHPHNQHFANLQPDIQHPRLSGPLNYPKLPFPSGPHAPKPL